MSKTGVFFCGMAAMLGINFVFSLVLSGLVASAEAGPSSTSSAK